MMSGRLIRAATAAAAAATASGVFFTEEAFLEQGQKQPTVADAVAELQPLKVNHFYRAGLCCEVPT